MRLFGLNKVISTIIIIIIVVLLLSFVSLFFPAVTEPGNTAANLIVLPFQKLGGLIQGVFDSGDLSQAQEKELKEELADVKTRLATAERELREAMTYKEENERYRKLLSLKQAFRRLEVVSSYVSSWQSGSYCAIFNLQKGSKDGIEKNMPVITDEGLVGYVSAVSYTYCEVTTLIDTTMVVGVQMSRTGEIAVCEGDFSLMQKGLLKLSYLPKTAAIAPGDLVVTTGAGELYPKGIVVGTVSEVLSEEHGLSNYAVITPAVNLDKLTQVLIVTDFEIED